MVEAAVPTITVHGHLADHQGAAQLALVVSVAAAVVLLVVRLVQRSTVQFVVNALVGIGIGWLLRHACRPAAAAAPTTRRWRTSCPGIIYNAGYSVVLALTCLIALAAGRLHGRQRHRRPDRLAPATGRSCGCARS